MGQRCHFRILACCLTAACCSAASGQHGGHGVHPPMPDTRFFVHVGAAEGASSSFSDTALRIRSASSSEDIDQLVASPDSSASVRVVRYLPSAELEQSANADETGVGRPAVEIAVEGPSQTIRRWLLADDPERNRLISYIGTWRYIAVTGSSEGKTLYEQFENELTRPPTIRVSPIGKEDWREVSLELGRLQSLPELGCTVVVRQFLPDYAMDRTTLTPTSLSERKKNPAAFVEIEHRGVKDSRWVFAKFPDFAHASTSQVPFLAVLDCPIETDGNSPDFAIVTVAGSQHEVWTRKGGKSTVTPMTPGTQFAIPESQYGFHIVQYVSSARLVESYRPTGQTKGRPAINVAFSDKKGQDAELWLGMGHFQRIVTQQGPTVVGFDDRAGSSVKGHP